MGLNYICCEIRCPENFQLKTLLVEKTRCGTTIHFKKNLGTKMYVNGNFMVWKHDICHFSMVLVTPLKI